MWKTAFFLRDATDNFQQVNCGKVKVFHKLIFEKIFLQKSKVFHSKVFHFPQPLWKALERKFTGRN